MWPVVPKFQDVNGLTWGSFNSKNSSFSPNAWDLKAVLHYPRVIGLLGLHCNNDWALSPTWYHRNKHWRACIPKIDGNYNKE
jgi:hypothetical protein